MTDMRETRLSVEDGIGTIMLDRPDRLNAYTPDMGDELVAGFRALAADPAVRAIMLTGAGRAFCAGADRAHLSGRPGRNGLRIGQEAFLNGFAAELLALDKPFLAAVNGPAIGIGATMLLTADAILCGPAARFDFPFTRLGLVPGMGATGLLPVRLGEAAARRILLTGGGLDAETALSLGLVTALVADADLRACARALALEMAAGPPAAFAACKRLLNRRLAAMLPAILQEEAGAAAALAGC